MPWKDTKPFNGAPERASSRMLPPPKQKPMAPRLAKSSGTFWPWALSTSTPAWARLRISGRSARKVVAAALASSGLAGRMSLPYMSAMKIT
ncbi:hypothetical protein D9M70_576940 [compost metagenome]